MVLLLSDIQYVRSSSDVAAEPVVDSVEEEGTEPAPAAASDDDANNEDTGNVEAVGSDEDAGPAGWEP